VRVTGARCFSPAIAACARDASIEARSRSRRVVESPRLGTPAIPRRAPPFSSLHTPSEKGCSTLPSDPELDKTWDAFTERLRAGVPDDVYRVWLEPLQAVALRGGVLYVEAPQQTRHWVRRRFGVKLSATAASLGTSLERVEIVEERGGPSAAEIAAPVVPRTLNPAHRFEEFVIGSANRFAHAAALAVAELPAQAYNPLFVCGPPGVGKTHLLNAIGNYTVLNDSSLGVRYATAETFTGQFTNALRAGEIQSFKNDYRLADVLLLDDVQFFESKTRTGEELLHTFEVLLATGAQVVLAADRPPSAMPALDPRLRDRLESGLIVDLHLPDFETRLSIIKKRAGRRYSTSEQQGALEFLARQVSSSVHALEGALTRVRAYASLTQQPLTTNLVEHVLASLYADGSAIDKKSLSPTVERIQATTSSALDLPVPALSSPKRGRQVVYARQVAMYLCRELTDLSLPAIGQRFGGRDHSTVLHACRQVRNRILTDPSTRELVENIITQLGQPADKA
jgi:chromosomal replication initiator protein